MVGVTDDTEARKIAADFLAMKGYNGKAYGPIESDPTGKSPHAPGAKLDAGKPRPGLVLGGFARALMEITRVGTYGAVKYTDNGWMEVEDGEGRYDDAGMRHWLREHAGEQLDPDTELLHLAHGAWNALARLDLVLRMREAIEDGSD